MQLKARNTTAPPLDWPCYGEDEIAAVVEVLEGGRVNQWTAGTGGRVAAFERAMAARHDMPHAVAVFNGTLALELALRAFGIGPGDEVIVTARSFMASASCVSVVGATPVFTDVDSDSQNMTPATIAPLIGPKTRAIIPVHLAGWPCDLPGITALAHRHGLRVIEDVAQAIGARIDGRPAGSFGDAAAFSFCQDKVISTGGEGGMLLLRDEAAFRRAWSYKDHGKSYAATVGQPAGVRVPVFRYVHESIGSNWRMLEVQAAIGLVQLGKLDRWLALRRRNSDIWRRALEPLRCLRVPAPPAGTESACYKQYAFLRPERLRPGVSRDDIVAEAHRRGLRVFSGSCPEIYREPAYAALAVPERPVATELGRTSLMFEVHPTLDAESLAGDARKVADLVAGFAQ